jgi:hypothetical protein
MSVELSTSPFFEIDIPLPGNITYGTSFDQIAKYNKTIRINNVPSKSYRNISSSSLHIKDISRPPQIMSPIPRFSFCSILYIYFITNISDLDSEPISFKDRLQLNCHNQYQIYCSTACNPRNNWHFVLLRRPSSSDSGKSFVFPSAPPNTYLRNFVLIDTTTFHIFYMVRYQWYKYTQRNSPQLFSDNDFSTLKTAAQKRILNYNKETIYLISPFPPSAKKFMEEAKQSLIRLEQSINAGTLLNIYVINCFNGTYKMKVDRTGPMGLANSLRAVPNSLSFPVGANEERWPKIDFSTLFDTNYMVFVTGRPKIAGYNFYFLFKPFNVLVWIGMLGSFVLATVCIGAIVSSLVASRKGKFDLTQILLWLFSPIMDQSCSFEERERMLLSNHSLRISLFSWIFSCFVLSNFYRSNLVAFLIQPAVIIPPTNLFQLANSQYEINLIMTATNSSIQIVSDILKKHRGKGHRHKLGLKHRTRVCKTCPIFSTR